MELVSERNTYTPALKHLNLEWAKIKYPGKRSPEGSSHHPCFTREEANTLLKQCKAAGVKMVMKVLPPQPKTVTWTVDVDSYGTQIRYEIRERKFDYPYNRYEECCRAHGYNL
jgi:hypothetical protein